MAKILSGKDVAKQIYDKLLLEASLLPVVPKLVVVLVGSDPASETYVRAKNKKCSDLGFVSETKHLPDTVSETELLSLIQNLNRDPTVHGILVQLPLPKQIDRDRVVQSLSPMKDVDGLHPENVGRLWNSTARFKPCTPAGIIEMLRFYQIPIEGKSAVVLGRSAIVGKPLTGLLLEENATVSVCHSKTPNPKALTKQADILCVAVGVPKMVNSDWVKPGATVIDVGIHRVSGGLFGDVDFDSVQSVASALTPVPGGVGPLTIAMLMANLVKAASL